MAAVSSTKYQWGREPCDTIGFSYRRDFRSIRDLRSPSSRLENKGSKSSTFDISPSPILLCHPTNRTPQELSP